MRGTLVAIEIGAELRPDGRWGVLLQIDQPETWVLMLPGDARHVAVLLLDAAREAEKRDGAT